MPLFYCNRLCMRHAQLISHPYTDVCCRSICHRHGIRNKEMTMGSCVAIVIVNFGSDAGECVDE